jgi:hypothetical protein
MLKVLAPFERLNKVFLLKFFLAKISNHKDLTETFPSPPGTFKKPFTAVSHSEA